MSRVAEPAKAGIGPSGPIVGDAVAGGAAPPASAVELAHKLAETREQQAATSEILRVISRSRTDAMATTHPGAADAMRAAYPRPAGRDNAASRAVLTRAAAAIPDVLVDAEYALGDTAVAGGFRSALAVPLMGDGHPIGAIAAPSPIG